ncbi:MAG: alpha-galactosidase [Pseudomonadota bacterium]
MIDATRGEPPRVCYWGQTLPNTTPRELELLSTRQWAFGGPDVDIRPTLSNELVVGTAGPAGFLAHRGQQDWATLFVVESVELPSPNALRIACHDLATQVRATYSLSLDSNSQLLCASTRIENLSDHPLTVDWCAALCIPLDSRFNRILSFTGHWAHEFQCESAPVGRGSFVRENVRGRTSHDCFPGLIVTSDGTNEQAGAAAAFHLGWSGNHRMRVDRHSDGQVVVQMGELFLPGEMQLMPGACYDTPVMYAAYSDHGLNTTAQAFHRHVLQHAGAGRLHRKPRPVHYNTWEAIYFDHDETNMLKLIEQAAAVGVERFVIDDGWFGGRRHDAAGLGDWWVSETTYPDGLCSIADAVREHGMELGIWLEPEMVNPDSDLFRAHPDWVLSAPGVAQIPSRNQLVLDLTKTPVVDYLFGCIEKLVAEYDIDYIKWDMNRDLQHPGSSGRAVVHQQTLAVYQLMARLRERFPLLEIESCSSGGGRADLGVLQQTDRLWLSDNHDSGTRQRIQRGASYFFPFAVCGTHVGARQCHITGRHHSMAYRVATAMFGHMGLEFDLNDESEADLEILKAGIVLHKQHRNLIHTGRVYRLDTSDYLVCFGVVAQNRREALFSCAKTDSHATTLPERLRLTGLVDTARYQLRILWPLSGVSVTEPSIVEVADLLGEGINASGESLMAHGVQLPLMLPDSGIILHLEAVENSNDGL